MIWLRGACALLAVTSVTAGCAPGTSDTVVAAEPEESAVAAVPLPPPQESPAGILLVTIDTLRWDALGTYGAATATPAIDALADRGVQFDYAVAHAVLTLPSHTSILTGLDPSRHGIQDNSGFRAAAELDTLAEILKREGYETGAFVAAFPLDSQFGLDQGFDLYDDRYDTNAFSEFQMVERPARDVVVPARRWIRQREGKWFAWVHVYDPHAPYAPAEPYASEYADDPYAGEVAATDAALAPLLEDALAAGALVLLTSDHGEGRGDHGELRHGVFAYESTLRVPLIAAWPEVLPAGVRVGQRVRHIDLVPTVCEILAAECAVAEGTSLLTAMRGGAAPAPGVAYFEAMSPYLSRGWAPLRGIYSEDWKYIDVPIPELYRMSADPGEGRNLAEREPEHLTRMQQRLAEHVGAAETLQAAIGAESEETLRRLNALGYLGGGGSGSSTLRDPGTFGPEDDPKNLIELDERMQEAVGLAAAGEVDRAAGIMRTLLDERPDFIRVHALLAGLEARRGNLEGAIEQLDRALRTGVQSPYLLTRLGMYLRDAGRLDEAAPVLEEALRAEPENLLTINLLAIVEGARGRHAEARRLIDVGLAIDPTYAPLHANLGTLALSQDRLDEARGHFDRALEEDVRLAEAHNGLGVIEARQGQLDAAVDSWRTAVSIDPQLHEARYNLAMSLLQMNRLAEAEPVLEEFLVLAPPRAWASERERVRGLLIELRRRQQR